MIYIALIKFAVFSAFTYLKVETRVQISQMQCTKKKKKVIYKTSSSIFLFPVENQTHPLLKL